MTRRDIVTEALHFFSGQWLAREPYDDEALAAVVDLYLNENYPVNEPYPYRPEKYQK